MRLVRERYTPGETRRGSVRARVDVVSEVPAGDESRVGTTA
jgi:hypothetical protein